MHQIILDNIWLLQFLIEQFFKFERYCLNLYNSDFKFIIKLIPLKPIFQA
jgi:hypothetical protein